MTWKETKILLNADVTKCSKDHSPSAEKISLFLDFTFFILQYNRKY